MAESAVKSDKQQQTNRYAHIATAPHKTTAFVNISNNNNNGSNINQQSVDCKLTTTTTTSNGNNILTTHTINSNNNSNNKQHNSFNSNSNYSQYSFSHSNFRDQWITVRAKVLESLEEPVNQQRLILFIVCTALLLDNMLYMVIVPIIPDYLRSIGAWSTYAENARFIRTNKSGTLQWERMGGTLVYENEESGVGLLFASKAIVQLLVNPFSGALIDRIGYEIPMMFGLSVMFFSTMVFACGQTYSVLFLARSLQGLGSAFADTSGLAMIADRFTEDAARQRALGIALAFISFGSLVAPPFGAVLYQGAGKEVPFILLSLICLVDASLLLLVAPEGTFAQLLPNALTSRTSYSAANSVLARQPTTTTTTSTSTTTATATTSLMQRKRTALSRQKSVSRRHSITLAADGEAPRGEPIHVLLRDKHIACCAGALVVANVSLAFLEPTISIWMQDTMQDIEEWQIGAVWLPAFVPHVAGVYCTVRLNDKHPKLQWLIALVGLALEGCACLVLPFCASFYSLFVPISVICFGIALIDTAILPTLGFLVDTRYVSVYGSIYAIADISYSLAYAIGPIIAGSIVEAIGFTALNLLIAIVTLGYCPLLTSLHKIRDYEPFEPPPPMSIEEGGGGNLNHNNADDDDYDEDQLKSNSHLPLHLQQQQALSSMAPSSLSSASLLTTSSIDNYDLVDHQTTSNLNNTKRTLTSPQWALNAREKQQTAANVKKLRIAVSDDDDAYNDASYLENYIDETATAASQQQQQQQRQQPTDSRSFD